MTWEWSSPSHCLSPELSYFTFELESCKNWNICFSLSFFESHSSFFFHPSFPSGPPVIVGMSINIASIDSISEVNMVCFYCLISLLASTKVGPVYSHTAVLGVHATPTPTPVTKHLGANTHQCIYDCMIPYWLPTHKPGQLSSLAWMIEPDKEYHYRECALVFTLPPANQNLVAVFFSQESCCLFLSWTTDHFLTVCSHIFLCLCK